MTASVDGLDTLAPDRWQTPLQNALAWREWGDEFVVYVGNRADTHLLSAAAGNILLGLLGEHQALTLDALFARVFGETAGAPMSAEEQSSLRAVMQDFERLGIVTRQPA